MIFRVALRQPLTLSFSRVGGERNMRTPSSRPCSTMNPTILSSTFTNRPDLQRSFNARYRQVYASKLFSFKRHHLSISSSAASSLDIAGNASQETKNACLEQLRYITGARSSICFGRSVGERIRLARIDVGPKVEEPMRKEAKVVCEVTVEPDMVNAIGTVHGGCFAFLIDDCSSLPLTVLGYEICRTPPPCVSQNISTFYHAPAFVGSELRIISTSLSYGSRIMSARCEIWDTTKQRLVASGVHIMMQPSPPRPLE